MTKEQQELYDKFVDYVMNDPNWKSWQDQMAIEESLEFALSILHLARGKNDRTDLVSEIADIENMIGQIKAMHNITEEEVGDERIRKVKRAIEKHNLDL